MVQGRKAEKCARNTTQILSARGAEITIIYGSKATVKRREKMVDQILDHERKVVDHKPEGANDPKSVGHNSFLYFRNSR